MIKIRVMIQNIQRWFRRLVRSRVFYALGIGAVVKALALGLVSLHYIFSSSKEHIRHKNGHKYYDYANE